MGRNIVKAKLDVIFKRMFADEKNSDLLHTFISDILDIPYDSITSIQIQNPELVPDSIDEKFSRLDLKAKINDMLINVEIQLSNDGFYNDRCLYNWARLFTSELKKGEAYGLLNRSVAINITNFNMFDCGSFHSSFSIWEDNRHECLSDKCAIHFFELKKIKKKPNVNDRKELWMQLINAESEEELEMLNNTNVPAIKKAVKVIYDMSSDAKIREEARMREKALHDRATALYTATEKGRQQGIQQGIQQGRQEGIQEIIAKMRKNGLSDEQIEAIIGEQV